MNGEYAVTSVGDVDTNWNSDYASKGYEYFDVWAPEIATRYGEVFWTDQGSTPLPADIVKRFDGKVIAIQGYEQDQVMVTPTGSPGKNPEQDVSVPINWAYNHHYCAHMTGKHAERKLVDTPKDSYGSGAHGMEKQWMSVPKEDRTGKVHPEIADSWFISEGNGGESRKSFHGYPAGFAQLMESPTSWHITPMQIDTRNRDHGVLKKDVNTCTNFTECRGYEPRQARFGRNWGGLYEPPKHDPRIPQGYSGILECPCNGRFGGDPYFYHNNKTKSHGALCATDAFGNATQPCKEKRATACEEHGMMTHGCSKAFHKNCVKRSPAAGKDGHDSGELDTDKNPTCTSGAYQGGLSCCSHGRIMLDADQTKHDDGPLLKYHMKFRFWYQEYKPEGPPVSKGVSNLGVNASHVDLPRIYWQTEGDAGEYDIPPAFWVEGKDPKIPGYHDVGPYPQLTPGSSCTGSCPDGPDCDCIHTITYNHTVSDMRLIYAGGHCHAPACIGIWLYRNDPGHEMELMCHQAPLYGNGTLVNSKAGIYDEEGYLALPPCLWGDEEGLHPSVLLPKGTEMVSIKKNRNTYSGHYGEMASWQMRGINY
jgi:hypothetical protein